MCRYQEAVRIHPGCPAEVRLGLAACYFSLGQLERAKRAYERVVQLSPGCAEALYGLAVLRFSSSQGESAKTVSSHNPCPAASAALSLVAWSATCFGTASYDKFDTHHSRTQLRFVTSCQTCFGMQSYREGLQLLCQAYDSDPRNPAVLNLLAHYCLTRKEYAKVSHAYP